jgi:hypothetical protein
VTNLVLVRVFKRKGKKVLSTALKAEAQLWLAEGQEAKAKAKHKII